MVKLDWCLYMDGRIEQLTNFCKKYGHWVKTYRKAANEEEALSNSLSLWIRNSHYLSDKEPFKYDNIKYKDMPIKYIIDDLYLEYGKNNISFERYMTKMLKEIIEFCEKNKIWPRHIYEAKSDLDIASDHYAKWLNKAKYNPNIKFYPELCDEDGTPLYVILNKLYNKYYVSDVKRNKILDNVLAIKDYCVTFREWPVKGARKEGTRLAQWLDEIGYNTESCIDKKVFFNDGTSAKVVLDHYYLIYNKNNYEELFKSLDIWKLKDSQDKIESLAGYIMLLSNTIYSNYEMFQYYIEIIKNRIKELNIKVDIKEIISDLTLAYNEQAKVYHKKYLECEDEDLAKLYFNLFNFAKAINEEINKEKEEKRRK